MTLDTLISQIDLAYLRRQVSSGEVILFTGAGFSAECISHTGETLPTGPNLREAIWPHAFPDMSFNRSENLGDIFEVALRQDPSGLKETLEKTLGIDASKVPAWYHSYMRSPWYRIYTLNFDDFWEIAPRIDSDARILTPVSATTDETLPPDSTAAVVHLNGRLSDYPLITVSAQQYGERQTRSDKWYQQLVSDLFGHAIIFIGTVLDEPPLWQCMQIRKRSEMHTGDRRPKSFLVSPDIGPAKKQLLHELNIIHLQIDAKGFSELVLAELDQEIITGMKVLENRRKAPLSEKVIEELSLIRAASPPNRYDPTDYLRGRQPMWSDLSAGVVASREFDQKLFEEISSAEDPRLVLVTGTAGSGKSTALMVAAATLHEHGHRVFWFDANNRTELHPWQLRQRIKATEPEYLFIDDADVMGSGSGDFLRDIISENLKLTVIASARANRLQAARLEREDLQSHELTVPILTNLDIDSLIDVLDSVNRLGFLKGKIRTEQREIFQRSFERQLIVAMLQATTGEKFEDIIKGECQELEGVAFDVYAMACLITTMQFGVRRDELMLALGEKNGSIVSVLDRLLDRRLLIIDKMGLVRARHRVIAEKAIDCVKAGGHLKSVIEALTWAFATKAVPNNTRSREHRIFAKLTNHDFLIEQLVNSQDIRPVYAQIVDLVDWDFHYWLQRGSFEVERGSITNAENYLAQAKSLAPDDLFVRTEWCYMLLVKATGEARVSIVSHREHADAAIEELFDIISAYGRHSPYPYYVLARQGSEWISQSDLSPSELAKYLERFLYQAREGIKYHPSNRELKTIEREVERAYLLTSVTRGTIPPESLTRSP